MLESTLEDEGPFEEFHSCTLEINPENRQLIQNEPSNSNCVSSDNNNINDKDNNNKTKWSVDLITPITSLPNKVTETLFSRNKQEKSSVNTTIQPAVYLNEDPQNYFTSRETVVVKALNECKDEFLDENSDGPLIEAFLLTLISYWNSDKERLILLTTKALVIVKYDFIAMKRLGYKKIPLDKIDEVIIGDLVYPSVSLIPHIDGFIDIVENCLLSKWLKNEKFYQSRNRNTKGIRLIWNQGKLNFTNQWNPFSEDLPFCTLTYHPLYYQNESTIDKDLRNLYNLEIFIEQLQRLLETSSKVRIEEKSIILQNYVGIGSIIHNRNSLGFFKVRGKFSF